MLHPYTVAILTCLTGGVRVHADVADPELEPLAYDFAAAVYGTLNDPRGWTRAGLSWCPSDGPHADLEVVLATPATVDRLCYPIRTNGEVSCALDGRAVINLERWERGTPAWSALTEYRHYVVNHEVGHLLGLGHAHRCVGLGRAPLMMQQSRRHVPCDTAAWPTFHEVGMVRAATASACASSPCP